MSLATSYARALYEAARDLGANMDQVETQMGEFADLLGAAPDLKQALFSPVLTNKEKVGVLDTIASKAGFPKIFHQFLLLLASKERLSSLPSIRDAFTSIRLEAEGGLSGTLVSADAVEDGDVRGLADAFSKKLGKKVSFRVSTDPALLAGMKVTVNGVTYDGSLKSQLVQLRDAVIAGHGARSLVS